MHAILFLRTPLRTLAGRVVLLLLLACVVASTVAMRTAIAQQHPQRQQSQPFHSSAEVPTGGAADVGARAADATVAGGGAAMADFDSLIDLIVSTVALDTWAEHGGTAEVRAFPGGVLVDAGGTLRLKEQSSRDGDLAAARGAGPPADVLQARQRRAAQASVLRYVSLPRLEREIARRQADREPLEPAMLTLAGLQRVEYVFLYPETGDVVLAGPAGDWHVDQHGRIVSSQTGAPVVRLDDLLVLMRRTGHAAESFFGCSINPRQEALAQTQAFLDSTSQHPLLPGQRARWLSTLRETVGLQDIEVFGIDPSSRVAGVLVEADYHMKLIGMGLERGVDGVQSYLASIRVGPGEAPPPLSVLRWWFALGYEAVRTSDDRDAFQLVGQGVRVLSENELLAEQGQRVPTGESDPLNRQFAESFTTHFAALADKYPVYAELRNIFDLAMAVALIQTENLAERAGWEPTLFTDQQRLRLPAGPVPRQVETVINHRVINRRHIVAGVSGGVMVAPSDVFKSGRTLATDGALTGKRIASPINVDDRLWWWDAGD